MADLAGVTVKAVGVLEYERRWPYPHAVRSLADALRLDDANRAALVRARGRSRAEVRRADPEHRGHSTRSGLRRPFTPASSSRLLTVTSL